MNGKRERILQTATDMFMNKGIAATSMEQIAEAVPVSKMTIYKYFQSKEGLLKQILLQTVERYLNQFRAKVNVNGNPFEVMLQMARNKEELPYSDLFLKELLEDYPSLVAQLMEYQKRSINPELEQMIFRTQQEGIIRKDLSPHVLMMIMMGIKEFFTKLEVWQEAGDLHLVTEQIINILYFGIMSDEYKEKMKGG